MVSAAQLIRSWLTQYDTEIKQNLACPEACQKENIQSYGLKQKIYFCSIKCKENKVSNLQKAVMVNPRRLNMLVVSIAMYLQV